MDRLVLTLHLDFEFWDAIACGEKVREYRAATDYWRKMLAKPYTEMMIGRAYPKTDDAANWLHLRWAGFQMETITHRKFGGVPTECFAIDVTKPVPRVYVDKVTEYPPAMIRSARVRRLGNKWSHLWCDPGAEEKLHAIAKAAGMRREWFQNDKSVPHYDLVPNRREAALEAGAVPWDLAVWMMRRIKLRKVGLYEETYQTPIAPRG